jgi:glutathione peroxidase
MISLIAFIAVSPMFASPDPMSTSVAPEKIYDFTVKSIEGKETPLEKYRGKVLLVVNVASKCGLTPQYKALEAMYRAHKGEGLVVLGFPANNFGGQEPGSNEEIQTFCSTTYDVTFPMFSKVSVKGDDIAPLFKWLIANADRPNDEIEWNFAKFLVGRDGKVRQRFSPRVTPDSDDLKAAVKAALAEKA